MTRRMHKAGSLDAPLKQPVNKLEHIFLTNSLKLCPRSFNNGAYQKRNISHFKVFRMNQQGSNSRSFPLKKITSSISN
jgi:hypothetical protein